MLQVVERSKDWLERLLPERGQRLATAPTVPFIVLARSRTGSNLLTGMLNSHPRALVFGELFQNRAGLDWAMEGYPTNEPVLRLWRDDPVAFLERHVFARHRSKPSAVGFKLFYYHAHDELWQPVWTYLVERQELRVLHMKRNNILRTFLSRKRAEVTDTWVNLDGEPGKAPSVRLDYEECLQAFEQTRGWEQEYAHIFKDHPMMDVVYEELVDNQQQVMDQVQEFLSLRGYSLRPNTHKQSQDSLATAITNYQELKAGFAGTPWAEFFDE